MKSILGVTHRSSTKDAAFKATVALVEDSCYLLYRSNLSSHYSGALTNIVDPIKPFNLLKVGNQHHIKIYDLAIRYVIDKSIYSWRGINRRKPQI